MGLFRSSGSPHQTALAMIGVKAGDTVLILGADDPDLCGEIARVTGLNGRTVVVDPAPDAPARLEEAGGRAGGLVESVAASLDGAATAGSGFDIAVIATPLAARPESARASITQAALGALRAGGRLIAIDGARKSGLLAAFRSGTPRLPEAEMRGLLGSAGVQAVRPLATVDEITYWEARK